MPQAVTSLEKAQSAAVNAAVLYNLECKWHSLHREYKASGSRASWDRYAIASAKWLRLSHEVVWFAHNHRMLNREARRSVQQDIRGMLQLAYSCSGLNRRHRIYRMVRELREVIAQ